MLDHTGGQNPAAEGPLLQLDELVPVRIGLLGLDEVAGKRGLLPPSPSFRAGSLSA
ncbi:hypothetical protein [Streptomyces anulatus]|uniref:hypothetical protein n=1 Tax=Streptomyces anulatus TaxID=1892 RepID=UPI00386BF1BD